MYWDANNLCGCEMSQTLPVDNFEWEKNTSDFDESFIRTYNDNNDKGYIFEVDADYSNAATYSTQRTKSPSNNFFKLSEKVSYDFPKKNNFSSPFEKTGN